MITRMIALRMDNFQVSTRCVVSDDERAIRLARVYDLNLRLKDNRLLDQLVGNRTDAGGGTHASNQFYENLPQEGGKP